MTLYPTLRRMLAEAAEGERRTFAFFPGRFQPMHKGHKKVYDDLVRQYGAQNVYVLTSDSTDAMKSPFTFKQKRLIMTRLLGIPADRIIQTNSPYRLPTNVVTDPERSVALFAVSDKDMGEDPRFKFKPLADGSAPYLQKYPGDVNQCETADVHGYVYPVHVETFTVAGEQVTSATDVRKVLAGQEDEAKQAFTDLYGKFDQQMFDMMRQAITAQALDLS